MNIDEFLRLGGAELSAVIKQADSTVGLGEGEVLLAVGSLAEDMGTSKSDLDLLLITSRGENALPAGGSVSLVAGTCLIDMRILRAAELGELLAGFKMWSQSHWDVTHAVDFTMEERTLFHRLLHGRVLHKGKRERVTARLPPVSDVARLKLQVARQAARTIQVDMVGYREVGDYRTLVFAAQEVLGHAVDALLAGHYMTNPLIKWRSRLLDAVPADWERSLSMRPTGLTAGERMWRLHRAPARPAKRLALEHAFRITTFARAVFAWAELLLVNKSVVKQRPTAWPQVEGEPHESPLPYLDFNVDFVLGEDRVTIARLNEFGETLEMSPREFALTLLFDGATTAREAELAVYGPRRGATRPGVVARLVSRVTQAGLCVSPNG